MIYSVFFFFKQKTAYEMRISDWSSDVCSSDLGPLFTLPGGDARVAVGAGYRKNDFETRSFTSDSLTEGKRSSRYAYGEILLPLVAPEQGVAAIRRLEVTAAFRHEEYGSMGKVTTTKHGLIYQLNAEFSLKASWGKSYKARSEEHTSELQSLMRNSTADFRFKK